MKELRDLKDLSANTVRFGVPPRGGAVPVLNFRTTTSQKCAAVLRRARIQGS